jgi:hypothetical protein
LKSRGAASAPDKGRQVASITNPEPEERRLNSLTQHQAFPAVVALWFAALLGLGSLILPAALLERLVETSGLASIVPAAAPPLGLTARALVALVAALGGAALGLMLARRVIEASSVRRPLRRARDTAKTRLPLNVLDELDGEGVTNGHAPPLSRRRAALMAAGEQPYESAAPTATDTRLNDDEPLILSDLAAQAATPPEAEPETTPAISPDEDLSMTAEPPAFPRPHPTLASIPAAEEKGQRQVFTGSSTGGDNETGLDSHFDEPANPEASATEGLRAGEVAPEATPLRPVASDAGDEESPATWEEKPLDQLGLVQLVQRLGSSLERRRAALAQAAQQSASVALASVERAIEEPAPLEQLAPAVTLPETGVEAARAEEAALARAAWFGLGSSVPAAAGEVPSDPASPPVPTARAPEAGLRPAFLSGLAAADLSDEDEEDEPFPDFNLPLRATVEKRSRTDEDGADGYRSLLALNGPGSAEKKVVRLPADESAPRPNRLFDAPGSQPFGKQAPTSSQPTAEVREPGADTDAALRAALATLQRMSGPA